MVADKKSVQQEIADLEGTRRGLENQIRVTQTNMTNVEFVERSIAEHRARIEWHQKCIEQLEYGRDNGSQIVADAREKIARINKQVKRLRHRRDVERMLELQRSINEASELLTAEERQSLAALLTSGGDDDA
jgi:chromosome segregation ATPase